MITTQARRVRDALTAIGLQHRSTKDRRHDFAVRTHGDGMKGFGDAYAVIYGREAVEAAAENADKLAAEFGVHVTLFRREASGEIVHVSVTSRHPARVDTVDV